MIGVPFSQSSLFGITGMLPFWYDGRREHGAKYRLCITLAAEYDNLASDCDALGRQACDTFRSFLCWPEDGTIVRAGGKPSD